MGRKAAIALLAALLGTNAFWLYHAIDVTVTLDHQRSELARRTEQVELLASLALTLPRDQPLEETRRQLQQRYPGVLIKVDENGSDLLVDDIVLEFGEAGLVRLTAR